MKINKRYAVGIPVAILMTPIMVVGFLCKFVYVYFRAGNEMYDLANNELEKWLDK